MEAPDPRRDGPRAQLLALITPAVLWAARQLGDGGQQAALASGRLFADLTGRQAQ